jgi:Transposase and inactivated derivatives
MLGKFHDKYRIPSARLQCWDYGSNAAYFITICTANRERYFGEIVADLGTEQPTMQLSEIGYIAVHCWQEIPNHFPFVILDEYVVMPNHVHGIIIINKPDDLGRDAIHRVSMKNDNTGTISVIQPDCNFINTNNIYNNFADDYNDTVNEKMGEVGDNGYMLGGNEDAMNRVSTDGMVKQVGGITGNNNPMLHENISCIIRWYKGRVSYESVKIHAEFAWQTRFHDHIIRNDESFQRIRSYIAGNPASWEADTLYG